MENIEADQVLITNNIFSDNIGMFGGALHIDN
jgi:hypothetical protein